MKIDLKVRKETVELDGVCPDCKEHTTAGDSCCGSGAYVEGGLITDDEAIEATTDESFSIKLLVDQPHALCAPVKSALFKAGIPCSLYGYGTEDRWTLVVYCEVNQLPLWDK